MNPELVSPMVELITAISPIFAVAIGFTIAIRILIFLQDFIVELELRKQQRKAKDQYEPPDSLVDESSDGELVYWDFGTDNGKRKNDEEGL